MICSAITPDLTPDLELFFSGFKGDLVSMISSVLPYLFRIAGVCLAVYGLVLIVRLTRLILDHSCGEVVEVEHFEGRHDDPDHLVSDNGYYYEHKDSVEGWMMDEDYGDYADMVNADSNLDWEERSFLLNDAYEQMYAANEEDEFDFIRYGPFGAYNDDDDALA